MLEQIDKDLKAALLSGDKIKAETLRNLKSALLNEAIAQNARDAGLSDEQVQKVLAKESKKRTEAAELYAQNNAQDRADAELAEKAVIEAYLPEQLSEEEIAGVVKEEVAKIESPSAADMGKIIGGVRGRLGAAADGATIARLVKEAIEAK